MRIQITRAEVMSQVSRILAYVGAKSDKYERTIAVKEDASMLCDYWRHSLRQIAVSLRPIIMGSDDTADAVTISLAVSDDSILPWMLRAISDYLAMSIVAQWLRLVGADEAADYKAVAATMLDDICRSLLKAPTRRRMSVL